jgi:hypothetical protein
MTRDEARLVLFVLLALSIGAGVQWWRRKDSVEVVTAAPVAERKKGWATPPYVFKSRADLERVKESLEDDRARR